MTIRRVIGSFALATTLAFTVLPATQAAAAPAPVPAAPTLKTVSLHSYTVTVGEPYAPATACDDGQINCGYIEIQATFAGLSKLARPATPASPREGNLSGTVEVLRTYGCQDAAGKRLASYDTVVAESAYLNTRRSSGLSFPRTGDTVSATTYAFLTDAQPGNCPAGTIAMTYKILPRNIQLALESTVKEIPGGSYRAPTRSKWIGAVPAPTAF